MFNKTWCLQPPPWSAPNSALGLQNQGLQIQWAMLQEAGNRKWKLFYSPLSFPPNILAPWNYTIKCISAHAQDNSHIQSNSGKNAQFVLCPPSGMGDLVTHFQSLRLSEINCWNSGTYVRRLWTMCTLWTMTCNNLQIHCNIPVLIFRKQQICAKGDLSPFRGFKSSKSCTTEFTKAMFLALIFYLVILCQTIDDKPADFPVVIAKYKPSAVPYNFKADPFGGGSSGNSSGKYKKERHL